MRRRGLVSQLYRTARLANDVSAITSGNPHRIARRAKNRMIGRTLAHGGFWRLLWGGGRRAMSGIRSAAEFGSADEPYRMGYPKGTWR